MASNVEQVNTPAAFAKSSETTKSLVDEVASAATTAERRPEAAEELKALASKDATAFAALQRSDVVGRLWRLCAGEKTAAEDVEALCAKRDANRDAVLPPVLDALAEIALLRAPALLGQQLSTLPTVLAVCRSCGRPGAPSERASPERLCLLAGLRWLAALSTHPVSKHLLKQGLAELVVRALSLRTDQDLLLQCCVLSANVAADGSEQARALCRAKVPRLLSRLLVAEVRPELKEHAVAALNRITRSARGEPLDADEVIGPVALALLSQAEAPDAAAEGTWALHVLSSKGGSAVAKRMAATPEVMDALEARALGPLELEDGDIALANKVAQMTFEDLTKLNQQAAAEDGPGADGGAAAEDAAA